MAPRKIILVSVAILALFLLSGIASSVQATSNLMSASSAKASPRPNQFPTPSYGGAYFGLLGGEHETWQDVHNRFPEWHQYFYGSSSSNPDFSSSYGMETKVFASGSWLDNGVVNSSALNLSNGVTLSFQIESTTEGRVVLASSYVTSGTEILGTNGYIDFCVCENYPEVRLGTSSITVLWQSIQPSDYAAWAVRIGSSETGLTVYIDTGSGWVVAYNNPTLTLSFSTGYLYAFTRSDLSSSYAYFAYLNWWGANQPEAEGTLDQNVWYLARHIVNIDAGSYSGDAAILDTSAPPIWFYIPSYSTYMYVGEATNDQSACGSLTHCNVLEGVTSQSGSSQTLAYLFCFGQVCNNAELSQAEQGSIPSSTLAYVTVTQSPSTTQAGVESYVVNVKTANSGVPTFNMYWSDTKLYTGPGSYSTTINTLYGNGGLRYVGRHITTVAAYLLDELGYGRIFSENFSAQLQNLNVNVDYNCAQYYSDCAAPYTEYYSPMFPALPAISSEVQGENWFLTTNSFPGQDYYNMLPTGTTSNFTIPGSGSVTSRTQYGDPYISRLAVGINGYDDLLCNGILHISCASVQTLWFHVVGTTPSTFSLEAQEALEASGSSTTVEEDLSQVKWDGLGTSKDTRGCIGEVPAQPSIWCLTTTETGYATYATAAFLSAASQAAYVYSSDSTYQTWALQSADALISALWSGTGQIAGYSNPITLWQFVGGEMSAYNPDGQPISYASNQGGIVGELTDLLQQYGVNGVQPPESAGWEPVATEATGLSAAALYNFIAFEGNGPAAVQRVSSGNFYPAILNPTDTYWSCNPACTGGVDTSVAGQVAFGTTGTQTFTTVMGQTITISQPVPSSTWNAGFWINGLIGAGSTLTLSVELTDPNTGYNIGGFQYTFNPISQTSYNQFIPVHGAYGLTIRPGTYLEQYVITASGTDDFWSSNNGLPGFIEPVYLSIIPNALNENFRTDPSWANSFSQYKYQSSNANPCTFSQSNTSGLSINIGSSNSSESYCGISSQSPLSATSGDLILSGDTYISSNAVGGTTANLLLTSRYLGQGTNVMPPPPPGNAPSIDYIWLQEIPTGTGYQAVAVWCGMNLGKCSTAYGPSVTGSSGLTMNWFVDTNFQSGYLDIKVDVGSGMSDISGFPQTGEALFGTDSFWLYLFGTATTSSSGVASFQALGAYGDSGMSELANTGDMNQFNTVTSPLVNEFSFNGNSGNGWLVSSSQTTAFDSAETVGFWMNPFSVGGNNPPNTGSSTMVVSNGGCCSSWWFEYTNAGAISFNYILGGTQYKVVGGYDLTGTNTYYYITGTYNSSTNQIAIYIDGKLQNTLSVSGSPYSYSESLYVGSGDCGQGSGCWDGNFYGLIHGLTISTNVVATSAEVAQIMDAGSGGVPLGSSYWYPLVGSSQSQAELELFGVGPALVTSGTVSFTSNVASYPYFFSAQRWTPFFTGGASQGSPYTTSVDNSGSGNPPPSLKVAETQSVPLCKDCYGGWGLGYVDLSLWNSVNPLYLKFDYRATSTSSAGVTNFAVIIWDANSGAQLYSQIFTQDTTDSGWRTFQQDIASQVYGHKGIIIFLAIHNAWFTDYSQTDWFDNIKVEVPAQPSFYSLDLYQMVDNNGISAHAGVYVPNYQPPSGSFSISLWFEPWQINYGDNPRLIATDHTDSNNKGFELYYKNAQGSSVTLYGAVATALPSTTPAIVSATVTMANETWYNVVMTWQNNGDFCLYFNGAQAACQAWDEIGAPANGAWNPFIGFNPAYGGDYFPGDISDLRIYDYAVSSSMASSIYSSGPTSTANAPDSLWITFNGDFTDILTGQYTAVPQAGTYWATNYVTFNPQV